MKNPNVCWHILLSPDVRVVSVGLSLALLKIICWIVFPLSPAPSLTIFAVHSLLAEQTVQEGGAVRNIF